MEEKASVVAYCLELAAQRFLLTHSILKYHVDSVLQAWLRNAFPWIEIRKHWTDCFFTHHKEHLGTYWSSPLDGNQGHAVNKNTYKAWCDLLKDTLEKYAIKENCIWAADETGFQPGSGMKQCVISSAKQKMQHQQNDGLKENITVLVAIGADGSSITPTVIYKGQSFLTNWHQDNTLQAP